MTPTRQVLLKRLANFRTVPGHGADVNNMSDEKLETYVKALESMFKKAFEEEYEEDNYREADH
ncbi:hypothetical protein ABE237_16970 [Brevibacillus formosus]|uniref:hypothetical protein n=1 Tax=Brevibacillus TaxID=55080 RepID=UPI000D1012EB|nr:MULTISPECIES: hypothetical protein [Brevibacillus]MBG9944382.1 hypothetical protein [Brevibacillus formosus]MED1946266.1 hypothetical protein [Brevibacillus formosus]MED1998812.1 hypothetical protein [Brevibacillus formosus]MED2084131.1 hypothetical protein [Brevibacillus formosus]PSK18169.1 hypothetical protein C7R94_13425 [Brevibacillus sp. NRRL NRS-603]